jgi:hypothetical protein
MLAQQLPDAHGELRSLVDEMTSDPGADPKVLAEARSAQANSQYYTTWLMRLEGLARDEWEPGDRVGPAGVPAARRGGREGAATPPPRPSTARTSKPPSASPAWSCRSCKG